MPFNWQRNNKLVPMTLMMMDTALQKLLLFKYKIQRRMMPTTILKTESTVILSQVSRPRLMELKRQLTMSE
jgi:hypothetical protein